ncbi:hypothetical protein PG995_014638 [Apiospora arundinis]
MATEQIEFKPTHTFTEGYLKPDLLREYLIKKAGLKANEFRCKATAGKIDLMLIKKDPNFNNTHKEKIEECFREAERKRKQQNLNDMEESD